LVENAYTVIFCQKNDNDIKQIKDFCTGALFSNEVVNAAFCNSMNQFPRLHFFSFGNSMGREVEIGSILGPSLTISDDINGSSIDSSKYTASLVNEFTSKISKIFTLTNAEGVPVNDRVIPGAKGTSVTVVRDTGFLLSLFESLPSGDDVVKSLTGAGCVIDDESVIEALSNVDDCRSEHKQYRDEATAKPWEEGDDDE